MILQRQSKTRSLRFHQLSASYVPSYKPRHLVMAGSAVTCSPAAACDWENPDYEPSLPVSEKSNPLTRDIDRASASQIVRMLQMCDAQMFQDAACFTYQRLMSDSVVKTMAEVTESVTAILKDPRDSLVVLSGCGTSGRLAFLLASSFNRMLRQLNQTEVYSYIIAGGDSTLFTSQEAPEDDPGLGMLALKKMCEGKRRVLFIGISCGLSAPFVAGQLDFCLQKPEVFTPVLIGFNPAHQARDDAIPGYHFTFRGLVHKLEKQFKSRTSFIINPAVGPEAISGSSRMKGGSATMIVLETLLSAAHAAVFSHTDVTPHIIVQHLRSYQETLEVTYSHSDGITRMVEAAGESLSCGRRVYYLGWGSLGVLGLIDASECNPTFGAAFEDIRGFMSGGYSMLDNQEGPLTTLGTEFCIGHEDFLHQVLPSLTDQDTVVLLYTQFSDTNHVANMAARVREKTKNIFTVVHQAEGVSAASLQADIDRLCATTVKFTWPPSESPRNPQWELSTKLVLNAVSTGAHVLKGTTYGNHMIDVQVTNSKLFRRATRLLQNLSGKSELQCEEALLKSIYQVDQLTLDITSSDVTAHTATSRGRRKVVPVALVCLLTGCSIMDAKLHLERNTVVRKAVEEVM